MFAGPAFVFMASSLRRTPFICSNNIGLQFYTALAGFSKASSHLHIIQQQQINNYNFILFRGWLSGWPFLFCLYYFRTNYKYGNRR